MAKFDGILICTDLDGTLLKEDKTVSEENKQAIEYFKQEGGKFTFITGRMPFFVSQIIEAVHPNAPFGCVNGGGLYDAEQNEYVWTLPMPDGVAELIRTVDKTMPDVGFQVNTFQNVYFSKYNITMRDFRIRNHLPDITCPYDAPPEPIAKIVFGAETEPEIQALEKLLRTHPKAENFDFIRSEEKLFEILPKGSGKGRAIENLCNYLHIDKSKTIAVGDYNNDIAMFHAAGMGIAVENACKEALDAADFITVSNENHAIARVIADLEQEKFSM